MLMGLKLDRRFKNNIRGKIENYSFEVGVLKDSSHRLPRRGERGKGGRDVLKTYAGGPARKISSRDSGLSIAQVSKENRDRLGVNYLTVPFKKKNTEIVKFMRTFFDVVRGKSQGKRLENLLQAIVRNPILRGDYGPQSKIAKRIKGFSRPMIDTAQLFKALKAKVKKLFKKGSSRRV